MFIEQYIGPRIAVLISLLTTYRLLLYVVLLYVSLSKGATVSISIHKEGLMGFIYE